MQSVWAITKLVYTWQGGFSPGNLRKSPFHMQVHMSVYMQNHASICSVHVHPHCADKPHTAQSSRKTKKAPRDAWLLQPALRAMHCSPYTALPAPKPSPRPHGSAPALFLRLLSSQLLSQSAVPPHRTVCSESRDSENLSRNGSILCVS